MSLLPIVRLSMLSTLTLRLAAVVPVLTSAFAAIFLFGPVGIVARFAVAVWPAAVIPDRGGLGGRLAAEEVGEERLYLGKETFRFLLFSGWRIALGAWLALRAFAICIGIAWLALRAFAPCICIPRFALRAFTS